MRPNRTRRWAFAALRGSVGAARRDGRQLIVPLGSSLLDPTPPARTVALVLGQTESRDGTATPPVSRHPVGDLPDRGRSIIFVIRDSDATASFDEVFAAHGRRGGHCSPVPDVHDPHVPDGLARQA